MARMPTLSAHSPSRALRRTKDGRFVFDITERRHPRFNLFEKHWRFMLESYQGGPEYLFKGLSGVSTRRPGSSLSINDIDQTNLFRYFKEDSSEHNDRMMRAHRNNYSKKVTDQIRSFVARKPPIRQEAKASDALKTFWKNADGQGRNIDRIMAFALQWVEVFGSVWMLIDKPNETFITAEEEAQAGMPFAKFYFPFDVLDGGFDDNGTLKWVMLREARRLDDNPFAPSPMVDHFIIWDRFEFRTFIKNPNQEDAELLPAIEVDRGFHGLGFVPVHQIRFTESEDRFVVPGLLDDIAHLDRAVFNWQSQLDTIIFDQTFSQLAMPTDSLVLNEAERFENDQGDIIQNATREQTRKRLIEMGTKRVFLYNGQTTHPPAFISPDATQADVIRSVINDGISEVYKLANLIGDVGREVRTQTGVSKAYDFDRLNKVLAFVAQELQVAEFWIADTVDRWMQETDDDLDAILAGEALPTGTTPTDPPEDLVSYPENFDIMGLLEMLDIAFRADELDLWSSLADKKLREQLVARLFPSATAEEKKKMQSELDKREKREATMAERMPLDPLADPNAGGEGGDDRSQVRGKGGGATPPGQGPPTKPTTQQARDR